LAYLTGITEQCFDWRWGWGGVGRLRPMYFFNQSQTIEGGALAPHLHCTCLLNTLQNLFVVSVKDICYGCKLSPDDLVTEWIAFAQTSQLNNNEPKMELLDEFERKQLAERNKKLQTQFSKHEGSSRMMTKDDLDEMYPFVASMPAEY